MKTRFGVATVMLMLATAMASVPTDPFVGTWLLNPELSRYPKGSCPKRLVIEIESVGKGIHYRSETTDTNGNTAHSEYTAEYNGKQALVVGSRGMLLPVVLKRPNSHLVVASYTRGLRVVATSRRVISGNGKRMTITTVSKDRSGNSITTIGVYEKQRDQH